MAGYREFFIKRTTLIGGLFSFENLLKKSTFDAFSLVYHTVSDEPLPHLAHLYPVKTISQFEKDLECLLKHFEAVNLNDFIAIKTGQKPAKRKSFLLTFDDGMSQFYHIVAPLLLKKGIPAVCFINDNFVDNKELFYRFKQSLLIQAYQQAGKHFPIEKLSWQQPSQWDEIAREVNIDFDTYLHTQKPFMTSEQIVELAAKGFCFGAHSTNHPPYNEINLDEQLRQTRDSLSFVCRLSKQKKAPFAFPFSDYGVKADFFETMIHEQNLSFIFGNAGLKKETYSRFSQRIPMEFPLMEAEKLLKGELLYHQIKSTFA